MSDRPTGCTQPACDPEHRHTRRVYSGQGHLCLEQGCHCPGTDYTQPATPEERTYTGTPDLLTPMVATLHEAFRATLPQPPEQRDNVYALGRALEDFLNTVMGHFEEMPES